MSDILQELRDEADLCRNETADDIANLLDEAANEIQRLRAVVKHEDDCLEAVKAENAQIRLRLREHQCPRPCSQRPDDFTIGQCVDAGECGCGSQVAAYPDRLGRANSGMGLGLTSPSVPQSVLERLDWLEAQWTDAGNTIEIQSAEITRLRAENAKPRKPRAAAQPAVDMHDVHTPAAPAPTARELEFAISESGAVLFKTLTGDRAGELGEINCRDALALYRLMSNVEFIRENA